MPATRAECMEGDCPCHESNDPRLRVVAVSRDGVAALAMAQDRGRGPGQAGRAGRKRPPAQSQEFPPEAMDELLRQWEGQSAKLETLEVDIYRIDQDLAWGDEAHFAGHAAFKNPDLAYVDYRKVKLAAEPDPRSRTRRTSFLKRRTASSIAARSKRFSARARRSGTTAPTCRRSHLARSTRTREERHSTRGRCRFSSG